MPNPHVSDPPSMLACSLVQWSGDPARCNWCDTPLSGRQRRWCSSRCSKAWAVNHSFTIARQVARARDRGRCVQCGATDKLQVHHAVQPANGLHARNSCVHHVEGLQTLCARCHKKLHRNPRKETKQPAH